MIQYRQRKSYHCVFYIICIIYYAAFNGSNLYYNLLNPGTCINGIYYLLELPTHLMII